MGSVQKLATVVMVGLVALATVLTVYIANEPNRRDTETVEQEDIAIERGTELYINYCLQCHGPAGLGSSDAANEDPSRIGPALNQDGAGIPEENRLANFQSDNPADEQLAEKFLHFRITNGAPADPRLTQVMPAFGSELNVEEINDLVYMIMNVDWNYVYNKSTEETGQAVAQAECDENHGEGEYCDNIEEAPAMYPTVPPPASDKEDTAATPEEENEDVAATIHAEDSLAFSPNAVTVKPGDTIAVVGSGGLQHDFVIDELGILEDLPAGSSDTVLITIPEDAAPGDYTFYCSIPGHRESGMEGTLTIEG